MWQPKNGTSSREAWEWNISTQIQGTLALCFVCYCVLISSPFFLKYKYTMNMKFARIMQTSAPFALPTDQPHWYQFEIQVNHARCNDLWTSQNQNKHSWNSCVKKQQHTEKATNCLSRQSANSQSRAQERRNVRYTGENLLNSVVYRNRDI